MRVLAIDYGTVRIGLAICDPTGTLARPLEFLPVPAQMGDKAERRLVRSLLEIATKEKAERLLLGLPRHMNGDFGPEANRVKAFAAKIQEQTKLPLEFCDERLSTVQASRQLQEAGRDTRAQRSKIDSAAAAVLLQAWLDAKRPIFHPLGEEE